MVVILIRRLFLEAERSTRGDVLCERWLQVLWSKGIVGIRLGPWSAGVLDGEPSRHPPLELFGESRLRDDELELLTLLAATQHRALKTTERLATLHRKRRGNMLQADVDALVSKLERVTPTTSDRFDDQVRAILQSAMRRTRGKVYGPDGAAALLDLKPTTLRSKLHKYGVR